MSLDFNALMLLGQAEQLTQTDWWPTVSILLRLVAAVVLPWILGYYLAKWLRMNDYGWKLGLIFFALIAGGVIVQSGMLNLGVDLKGGVILIYEVDQNALKTDENTFVSPGDVNWAKLLESLGGRIDPSDTKDIVVRRYGDWQIEIIVPEVDKIEIEQIKKLIHTAGSLEFLIVANSTDHDYLIALAEEQAQDPIKRLSKYVTDRGTTVGYWARVDREEKEVDGGFRPLRVHVSSDVIRDATTGELIELPPSVRLAEEGALERYLIDRGIVEIDVLMQVDEELRVTGDHLGMCSRGYDETMRPSVNFNMKGQGVGLMAGMTGGNLPDTQAEFYRRMGITLDGRLLSAPRIMSTISDRGRITGNFTQEETQFLVDILQAGSLPAAMKKEPITENDIGALLGRDTIERGTLAIGLSLATVVVFILFWYRFAGIVACLALATNLLLILAFMMAFRAAVTLPGLAGLVLTVGMSVDANVLVFERLREELDRGSALRMAIRNGFARATTTIVDANLTTLITAIVLYAIGTDQIRGFAVTLILGILMSMFTAIFCSRVIFDIFERKRRLTRLSMMRMLGETHIDFLGRRHIAGVISVAIIVIGLIAVGIRGKQIFDIDFVGGTSVTMILDEPAESSEVRSKLDGEFANIKVEGSSVQCSVNRVDVVGQRENTVWKIDTSLTEVEPLQDILQETFPVAYYSMEFTEPEETRTFAPVTPKEVETPAKAEKLDAKEEAKPVSKPEEEPEVKVTPKADADAKPKEKAEPAATPEPKAESEPKPEAKPESKPEVEAEPEPAMEAKPEPEEKTTPEAKAEKPEDQPEPKAAEKPADETEKTAPKPAEDSKPTAEPKTKPEETDQKPENTQETKPKAETEPKPEGQGARRTDLPPDTMLALAGAGDLFVAQADESGEAKDAVEEGTSETEDAPVEEKTPAEKPAEEPSGPESSSEKDPSGEGSAAEEEAAEEEAAEEKGKETILTTTVLKFGHEINGSTLQAEILDAAEAGDVPLGEEHVTLRPAADAPDWRIEDTKGYEEWNVSLATNQESAQPVFAAMKTKMAGTPVWPSASKIGGKVAGDTRTLAIAALLTSLLGIIGYIWIRFQRVVYGLAAVTALVHDVLITLGAIAVSYWLAGVFGFLLIEEFKISLPVVAAFLTIIGYSLNDTIVVFDRIREVRGKSPQLTQEMINKSINQTLSRTLLTSLTTFIVVSILYALGGQGIHGFAFALVIGVIVGTYSSIFVASPALLWMSQPKKSAG